MRVCHCHGVTDREIRACVRAGATTVEAVSRACGAGASCGGCKPLVETLVEREQQRFEASNEGSIFPILAPAAFAG